MKNIKLPSNRNFGFIFFIVFFVIAFWPILNDETFRVWSLLISLIFLILGIFNSKILTPLNIIWMKFGLILGGIVSPTIMGIIFFGVVTPIGLLMRLFKKDLLNLRMNNEKSYWIEKDKKIISSMKDQF
mgnify:CR=1 FL=1|jgi:polyferredoxin|tara:strand:+ start:630 stop:1016 length:387 start_codon:yes stop_codon:yes gene_type:complete